MDNIVFYNICKKAYDEAKKPFVNNKANNSDIIKICIKNNKPYLIRHIRRTSNNGWRSRTNVVFKFFTKCCKLLDIKTPINIVLNIGLHDAYNEELGIMVFSLRNDDQKNIVIPDIYAMENYNGKLKINDNNTDKITSAIFVGSSTGSLDPKTNERLQLCNKYINHPNIKCSINNFYQIDMNKIIETYPNYQLFKSSNIDIQAQLKYKYVISVDGNTTAWDRIPWILNSKSLCLKKKSLQKNWYYDFLNKNEHYIEFDDDNEIETIINQDLTQTITQPQHQNITQPQNITQTQPQNITQPQNQDINQEFNRINKNANKFCKEYLTEEAHLLYMSKLLYNIWLNNSNK